MTDFSSDNYVFNKKLELARKELYDIREEHRRKPRYPDVYYETRIDVLIDQINHLTAEAD